MAVPPPARCGRATPPEVERAIDPADLRPDCARCQALCCAAPAFDRSEEFAIDKPACVACPNLDAKLLCRIHDRLDRAGFHGCVIYDCLGAGQRVVQELFPGRSWREEPELLPEMWRALTVLRGLHELILLLGTAARAPLAPAERRTLEDLQRELDPPGGWTAADLVARADALSDRARDFLRSLSRHFVR